MSKLISKVVSFVKENKIVCFALAVIVLSFIFLALPGQFVRWGIYQKELGGKYFFKYSLSGYEFIFNKGKDIYGNPLGAKVVGQGVIIIVFLALSFVGLCFSKKTSFFTMLTGLVLIVTAILFFTISGAMYKCYPNFVQLYGENDKRISLMKWVPYLLGALIVIAGILVTYKAVMMMKDEIKHPVQDHKKEPTYNYLKK